MNKSSKILLLFSGLALSAGNAPAARPAPRPSASTSPSQSPAAPVGDSLLEELVRKSVERAYDLRVQTLQKEKTSNDRISAWTSLLPTVGISGGRTLSRSTTTLYGEETTSQTQANSLSAQAEWTIWNNYQNIRNIRTAGLESRIQEIDSDLALQNFVSELVAKYLELQVLYEQRRTTAEVLESAREFQKEANEMATLGARTRLDVLDTDIQLRNFENDAFELENQIRSVEREFAVILNEPERRTLPKVDLLRTVPYFMFRFEKLLPELREILAHRVGSTSPKLRTAGLKLDQTLEQYRQTWLQYLPSTSIKLTQDWDMGNLVNSEVDPLDRKVQPTTTASLSLSWTVWDWLGTHRQIRNARKDLEIERINLEKVSRQVIYEVEGLLEQYDTSLKNIESSEMVVRQAEMQLDYSRSMYQLGRISLLQAQTATQRLSQARISLIGRLKSKFLLAARMLVEAGQDLLPEGMESPLRRSRQ